MSLSHRGTVELATPRLLLRPFAGQDVEAMFHNWASDPGVCQYLSFRAHCAPSLSRQMIDSWQKGYRQPDFYHWCICLKGQPIGMVGVTGQQGEQAELGICLGAGWQGQGYATEAMLLVIHFLFHQVGFQSLQACHLEGNEPCGSLLQACGMVYCGEKVGQNHWGEPCTTVCYCMEKI